MSGIHEQRVDIRVVLMASCGVIIYWLKEIFQPLAFILYLKNIKLCLLLSSSLNYLLTSITNKKIIKASNNIMPLGT